MVPWLLALVCMLVLIGVPVIGCLLFGVIYRALSRTCPKHLRMDGRTVIVTGSSAGIGKETALDLALRGARVIMACRNMAKAQAVADEIISTSGNDEVVVRQLDVSDFNSVRKFASRINQEEKAVHVLINNAGIGGYSERKVTADGHELTMATNHLGPFLLTHLLLGKLMASTPSRIVNVSSIWYIINQLDMTDVNFERRRYHFLRAYAQSKLASILFTRELDRRLRGTDVVTNSLHPGLGYTDILKGPDPNNVDFARKVARFIGRSVCRTAEQVAQTQIYLAVAEEGGTQSGLYYDNCQKTNLYFDGNNMELARQLWNMSCQAVKLAPEETIPEVL